MSVHDLPALNAFLNASSAVLLLTARRFIRRREIAKHRAVMIAAFTTSCVFLVSYLIYHSQVGVTRFEGVGLIRPVYFLILGTHTILAVIVAPMAFVTLRRGLRRDDPRHKRIAKLTYPTWLYVSVTGVLIYFILYSGVFAPVPHQ